jgi:hypothetical protein
LSLENQGLQRKLACLLKPAAAPVVLLPLPLLAAVAAAAQTVFESLRAAYPPPAKQSGLTMVETVGTQKEQSSW